MLKVDFIKGFKSGSWLNKAKDYFNNPGKMKDLLRNVLRYANKDRLKSVKEEIMLMYHFISDVVTGKYKDYNVSSLILIIAALIYLVAPADIVPDFIPLAGLVDDVTIVSWVFNEVRNELEKYKQSRKC